jgi:hypothetical protein
MTLVYLLRFSLLSLRSTNKINEKKVKRIRISERTKMRGAEMIKRSWRKGATERLHYAAQLMEVMGHLYVYFWRRAPTST